MGPELSSQASQIWPVLVPTISVIGNSLLPLLSHSRFLSFCHLTKKNIIWIYLQNTSIIWLLFTPLLQVPYSQPPSSLIWPISVALQPVSYILPLSPSIYSLYSYHSKLKHKSEGISPSFKILQLFLISENKVQVYIMVYCTIQYDKH